MDEYCDRESCMMPAVATIPMPNSEKRFTSGRMKDIKVCESHAKEAESKLYLVHRFDESLTTADLRHNRAIDAKHLRLRGSLPEKVTIKQQRAAKAA